MHFYLNIIPDKRTYCERCVQPGDGCHLADAFVHTEDNKDGRFAQLHLLWHFLPLQFIQGSLRSRIQPFTILIEVSIKMQLFTCFIQLLWHLEVIVFCIMSCADTAGLPEKRIKFTRFVFPFAILPTLSSPQPQPMTNGRTNLNVTLGKSTIENGKRTLSFVRCLQNPAALSPRNVAKFCRTKYLHKVSD